MELREIQQLMTSFDASGLTVLEVKSGEGSLRMEKGARPAGGAPAPAPGAEAAPAAVPAAEAPSPAGVAVKAPIVGVVYAAPGPDAAPYIQLGQQVEKGQTLCLIEAMKMMNEVPAPCAGRVSAIRFSNGELAEFGAVLVELEELPC